MFGTFFSKNPEILLDSFGKMKESYGKKVEGVSFPLFSSSLIKLYISLLGIPEIGFQVRFLHFSHTLATYIRNSPKTILDAGCGIGSYSVFLHKKYPCAKIIGGEIDKKKLIFCEKFISPFNDNISFCYLNISSSQRKMKKYDFIVNIDVLEHISNYRRVLRIFFTMLNKGGYLYIHTPHVDQKRLFSFSQNWHHEDHVREGFRLEILRNDIENLGFEIISAHKTFGFFGRFAWEMNHLFLSKSFILAGITFPFLYVLSLLDLYFMDSNGLGISILARKISK